MPDLPTEFVADAEIVHQTYKNITFKDINIDRASLMFVHFEGGLFWASALATQFIQCTFRSIVIGPTFFNGALLTQVGFNDTKMMCDFRKSTLRTVTFSNSELEGVNFSGTKLEWILFDNCSFKTVNFVACHAIGATLEDITGEDMNFQRATMHGAIFNGVIRKANFDNSTLVGAIFREVDIVQASFQNAVLIGSAFHGCTMQSGNFLNANMIGTVLRNTDLSGGNLTKALLKNADLANCILNNVKLESVEAQNAVMPLEMQGTNGKNGIFDDADFSSSNLKDCIFENASLKGCKFIESILDNTDFTSARLWNANFVGTSLDSASFEEAELENTLFGYEESELEYHFALTSDIVDDVIYERVFGFTGSGPYPESWLDDLIEALGGTTDSSMTPWSGQIIVIGREDFEEEYIESSLEHYDTGIQYMSQEDFVRWLSTGEEPHYVRGDTRITSHLGLSYVASIPIVSGLEWAWPSTDGGTPVYTGNDLDTFRDEHPLRSNYGYTVKEGTSVWQRQRALKQALSKGMSLQEIVTHLAGMVRLRKRMRKPPHGAIKRWEEDLSWLKMEYYDKGSKVFYWPDY